MDTIKDGDFFPLKIYRKEGHLRIDIDDVNKNKIDINSPESCSSFWGSEIRGVYFAEESRDVATHYRMIAVDTDRKDLVTGILIQT